MTMLTKGFAALWVLAALVASSTVAYAEKRTVCTITVNSSDEKEAFRRHLPHDQYQFVELVEYGRPDWLASACRRGVRCDLLIVSGHFNGEAFFPDTLAFNEHLPIAELERVSCSESCPGLFSQLKEVYLFGCDSLNSESGLSASADVVRSLVRSGHSKAEADRIARSLRERHGESNRTVMRRLFANVPVIYGFASFAPVGPVAGPKLSRHFQSHSTRDVSSGRPSQALLAHFAANSMTVTSGMRASDPHAAYAREVCRFVDERLSTAQKLRFVHGVMGRSIAETRMFFDRIERLLASLGSEERQAPPVAEALADIREDGSSREQFLAFARDSDRPSTRVRMTAVARTLGWLSAAEERAELVDMIDELIAEGPITASEIDLLCTLNRDGSFTAEVPRWSQTSNGGLERAAALACLGSDDERPRVLQALASQTEHEARIAEAYLHHHPIGDANALRQLVAEVARTAGQDTQARALGTLAKQRVSDVPTLHELVRLFPLAQSLAVQRAIAGILLRSDYRAIATIDTARALQRSRMKSQDGEDIIDILIRRIDPSLAAAAAQAVQSTRAAASGRRGS